MRFYFAETLQDSGYFRKYVSSHRHCVQQMPIGGNCCKHPKLLQVTIWEHRKGLPSTFRAGLCKCNISFLKITHCLLFKNCGFFTLKADEKGTEETKTTFSFFFCLQALWSRTYKDPKHLTEHQEDIPFHNPSPSLPPLP